MTEEYLAKALAVCACGCVASYFAAPWLERNYVRHKYRRMAKMVARTQKNRWN